MSNYFSNIAQRSIEKIAAPNLSATTNFTQNTEPEIGVTYEKPFEGDGFEKEEIAKGNSTFYINQIVENKDIATNISNYFSKNIERNIFNSNFSNKSFSSNIEQNFNIETQNNKLVDISNVSPQTNKNEHVSNQIFESNAINDIWKISEKETIKENLVLKTTQKLEPSIKENSIFEKTQISNNNQLQPLQEVQMNVKTDVQPQAPKLVIGKITVEITQPAPPIQQKVFNRIVQEPAPSNYSKMNRLSFGLSQL